LRLDHLLTIANLHDRLSNVCCPINLEREFRNANFGVGGLCPGGCSYIQYGIADHNNSLERSLNQGLKKFTRRARPSIAVALHHLKGFMLFQCKAEARKQFAYDVDYFGSGSKFYSGRHYATFQKGFVLAMDSSSKRPFFKRAGYQEWFIPSSSSMLELERLAAERVIGSNSRAKTKRLEQWLSTFRDFLKIEDFDEIEGSFEHLNGWVNSFYCLTPRCRVHESLRSESWRTSSTIPKECRIQYGLFDCTCAHSLKYNFCKHSFALALHQKLVAMPKSRSSEIISRPRKRGRPNPAEISHR